MVLVTEVNWPEVGKVLSGALTVLRYLFGFGFLVAAIKFFWQVAKAVNQFVHEQEDLGKQALRIAADAKLFADKVTSILDRHDEWLYEHESQLAVINHELGIDAPLDHPRRRSRRRRHTDRDLPTDEPTRDSDDASDDDASSD